MLFFILLYTLFLLNLTALINFFVQNNLIIRLFSVNCILTFFQRNCFSNNNLDVVCFFFLQMSRRKPNQILKEWPSYPVIKFISQKTMVNFELRLLLFGLNMESHRLSTGKCLYFILSD